MRMIRDSVDLVCKIGGGVSSLPGQGLCPLLQKVIRNSMEARAANQLLPG
jgi:hypothetical protein